MHAGPVSREAARLLQVGAALERAARGQEEAGTAATSREALNEWAATLETILTEPHADEPIPCGSGQPRLRRAALAVITGQGHRLDPARAALSWHRRPFPRRGANEGWIVCGRRSGKRHSTAFVASLIWVLPRPRLVDGEMPVLAVLARDVHQVRTIRSDRGGIVRAAAPGLVLNDVQRRIDRATRAARASRPGLSTTGATRESSAVRSPATRVTLSSSANPAARRSSS